MFGWGIKDGETYLSILSELLNSNHLEISWEIINTAVPGYNAVLEVETLEEKGLQHKPDIVIIHYCGHDFNLLNFIREQEDYFTLNQSFIIKYFTSNLKTIKMIGALDRSSDINFEIDPQIVPKQYRDMVGIKAYSRAMKELKSLSSKYKFDVVVLAYRPRKLIKNICLQLGFVMVDFAPLWQKYTSEQNIVDPKTTWRITPEDFHPSVVAHNFIANTLSGLIVKLNLNAAESRQSQ